MSSIEMSQNIRTASKERRRLVVLKIFLTMAIINNVYIAVACFALGGGHLLADAPGWTTNVIGAMGVVTVLGAIAALFWKKAGVFVVVAAGVVATGATLVSAMWGQAALFAVGTAFMVLLAHHLWSRFK